MAVARLKGLGFTILMDDFGSGYSSLNMLKDITVDIFKIDMGFLNRRISPTQRKHPRGHRVHGSLHGSAHHRRGRRDEEQVEFLQGIGCDYAQGYYFHRPMSTEALEQLLSQDGIVDYRGVLNPIMELIDVDALLHDDDGSRALQQPDRRHSRVRRVRRPFRAAASEQRVLPRHRMQFDRSARTTEPDLAPGQCTPTICPSCKACSPKRTSAPSHGS